MHTNKINAKDVKRTKEKKKIFKKRTRKRP